MPAYKDNLSVAPHGARVLPYMRGPLHSSRPRQGSMRGLSVGTSKDVRLPRFFRIYYHENTNLAREGVEVSQFMYMLEKTKAAMTAELSKPVILTDPCPIPGVGLVNIVKALADDIKDFTKKGNSKKV